MAPSILSGDRACIKCGSQDRTALGACKACKKRMDAAYRTANAEKAAAYQRAYYAQNQDRLKAASASRLQTRRDEINRVERERYTKDDHWRTKSPERYRETSAAYLAANREARRIYEHNRRARKRDAGGEISRGLAALLFSLQKGMCPCCNRPLGNDYHLDHRIPLARGGSNDDGNMQLLRAECNLEKNAKDPIDFMQSRGFLL